MIKLLKTGKHDSVNPIMFADNNGNCHCVWKADGLYCYSKFNGTDWEYLNDYKVIETIPNGVEVPQNGLCVDSNDNPYVLWAKPNYTHVFGGLSELYLTYWSNSEWTMVNNFILRDTLYGASLTFFEDKLYIGSLIMRQNSHLFTITTYQNGNFTFLNSIKVSLLQREAKVLLRGVNPDRSVGNKYLYCFWDCFDSASKWIEHVIYDIENNVFISTATRKINLSNNEIAISGFDFVEIA